MLEFLLCDEHTVTECVEHIGLAQSRMSTHLGCLSGCGYVAVRRAGRFAHYRVIDPGCRAGAAGPRAGHRQPAALAACMRIEP